MNTQKKGDGPKTTAQEGETYVLLCNLGSQGVTRLVGNLGLVVVLEDHAERVIAS